MTGAFALGMAALIVLFVAGIFWLARLIADSPEGYETDAGFFYGPMPPELPDSGFDGHPFENLGRESADALASPLSLSLHSPTDSREGQ